MKKLFKNSLLILSPLSVLIPLSCALVFSLPSKKKTVTKVEKQPIKPVAHKEKTNEKLLNSLVEKYYASDPYEKDEYISNQNNIDKALYDELNNSLTIIPLFAMNARRATVSTFTTNGINAIKNTLTNNWYWLLSNLKNMSFLFNPYGFWYRENDPGYSPINTSEQFEYLEKNNKPIIFSFDNPKILKYTALPLKDFPGDVYINKQMLYFTLENKTVAMLLTYQDTRDNNKKNVFFIPEVFRISQDNELSTDDFIIKMNEAINQRREAHYNDYLAYPQYGKWYIDSLYFRIFADEWTLANDLFNIIFKLNENQKYDKYIFKYTWGWINEK